MLILRGEYDAFSPADLVRGASATMLNEKVVLVPHTGHDVYCAGHDCLRRARARWPLDPEQDPGFETCLASIARSRLAMRGISRHLRVRHP